ncbi:MAG: HEXXH motif-containing putative peptide modification protein [Pseudomonadota bacterium]
MDLHNPLPDTERALALRDRVDGKLREALTYTCSQIASAYPEHAALLDLADRLGDAERLGGMAYVLNDRLVAAIEDDDDKLLERTVAAARTWRAPIQGLQISALFDGDAPYQHDTLYFDVCDEGMRSTYGSFFDAQPLTMEQRMTSKRALTRALERWATIDPLGYAEAQASIDMFKLIQSHTINAGSSITTLGMVRVSHLKPEQRWTRYLEMAAHEAGHQILNLIMTEDPLIDNMDETLYTSPIRADPRPLSGILHAYFVIARTLRLKDLLVNHGSYDPEQDALLTGYNNSRNPAGFQEKFDDCHKTLKEHARFTEVGQRMFNATNEAVYDQFISQ